MLNDLILAFGNSWAAAQIFGVPKQTATIAASSQLLVLIMMLRLFPVLMVQLAGEALRPKRSKQSEIPALQFSIVASVVLA